MEEHISKSKVLISLQISSKINKELHLLEHDLTKEFGPNIVTRMKNHYESPFFDSQEIWNPVKGLQEHL